MTERDCRTRMIRRTTRGPGGLRPGSALLMVMGVLMLLTLIVSTFVQFNLLNTKAAVARTQITRADLLAEGVLRQVQMLLAADLERSQETFDHPRYDPWLASILTDNSAFFNPINGAGSTYRYISRVDLADNQWADGAGRTNGGRNPEMVNMSVVTTNGQYIHAPTKGLFQDPTSSGRPVSAYYVDADGDGKADALLGAIGNGVAFPDGTCAYMAVRIVDNAHLNPNHHSKWPPFYRYDRDTRPNHVWDITSGRVDWGYLPDSTDPTNTRHRFRPRLPQVSFKNLRNMAMGSFGLMGDSPDASEPSYFSGVTGWSWDEANDRMTLSDRLYFAYEPGVNFAARAWAGITGTGTPMAGAAAWAVPTNARTDLADCVANSFDINDDLAIRLWSTNPTLSKYAMVYPSVFGTNNIGAAAIINLGGNAGTSDPNAFWERNFMRCVSGITRERTKRWMFDPDAYGDVNRRLLATPFDLRLLVGPGDHGADGAPTGQLMAKLNELNRWMTGYGILNRNGLNADGQFTVAPADRRCQYLANLCEYIKAPTTAGVYTPAAYTFAGNTRTFYGMTRQPYITEVVRDGGAANMTTGLAPGGTRSFNNVRVGIELYNPYDTPIRLDRYTLYVQSVAGGGVTRLGTSAAIPLASLQQIPAFGFVWIGTDYTGQTIASNTPRGRGYLALDAATADAVRGAGPRIKVDLRCVSTNNVKVLMDTCDTRDRGGNAPYTAGDPMNLGYTDIYGLGTVLNPSGLEFRDWDGYGLPAAQQARVVALANNGWLNADTQAVMWDSRRNAIYRPMTAPYSAPDYWYPASAVSTNLWNATSAQVVSTVALHGSSTPHTPGLQNPRQEVFSESTPPCRTGRGPIIFGSRIHLPNRGHDSMFGANFLNLGELALVTTVGNGWINSPNPDALDPNGEYCASQFIGAAAAWAGGSGPLTAGARNVHPITQTYNQPFITTPGFPGNWTTWVVNAWCWVNFERQWKFDIYEGASMLPSGLPECRNARILDFLTLYLGNGRIQGTAPTVAEFQPYTGRQDDTPDDFIPGGTGQFRPAYREGRINMNTAPFIVTRCLPYPYETRSDVLASPPPNGWYSDGCTAGLNVYFSEALSGYNPSVGNGYINTLIPNINKDPYFEKDSDIYLFAQAANPRLFGNFYRNAGLGWDCLNVTGCGGWIYSFGNTAVKHPEYKCLPHNVGYQAPSNKRIPYSSTPGVGGPLDYPEEGCAANMVQRDSNWANMTNVCSVRSDVYTVYVLIKLIRPTPGVINELTGQEFEELGETRLVSIVDRSNVQIDASPSSATFGRVNFGTLPRIAGKVLVEQR